MEFIKNFFKGLLKGTLLVTAVTLIVMYISSFAWYKIGMSYAPTMFGYTAVNSTESIDLPSIEKGDLIVAKEYLYDDRPDIADIVVYSKGNKLGINIIENTVLHDEEGLIYQVNPRGSSEKLYINNSDIIGELSFVAPGVGNIYDTLISPVFIGTAIALILLLNIAMKIYRGYTQRKVSSINVSSNVVEDINTDTVITEAPVVMEDVQEIALDEEVIVGNNASNMDEAFVVDMIIKSINDTTSEILPHSDNKNEDGNNIVMDDISQSESASSREQNQVSVKKKSKNKKNEFSKATKSSNHKKKKKKKKKKGSQKKRNSKKKK